MKSKVIIKRDKFGNYNSGWWITVKDEWTENHLAVTPQELKMIYEELKKIYEEK